MGGRRRRVHRPPVFLPARPGFEFSDDPAHPCHRPTDKEEAIAATPGTSTQSGEVDPLIGSTMVDIPRASAHPMACQKAQSFTTGRSKTHNRYRCPVNGSPPVHRSPPFILATCPVPAMGSRPCSAAFAGACRSGRQPSPPAPTGRSAHWWLLDFDRPAGSRRRWTLRAPCRPQICVASPSLRKHIWTRGPSAQITNQNLRP